LTDFSNAFDTIAAVATMFGPTGDFVALVAGVASQLFGVISGLFGIGHDAVTDALKTLEKDVMGRIQVAKDTVDQIRNTVKFKIISEIIGSDENTLVTLNGYYNTMVQSHNLGAQADFLTNVEPISTYIDSWKAMVYCLAGVNFDCIFQGQTALQILAQHGVNWYRPASLASSVQYYVQLLQQTALAICTYDLLKNNDKDCKLLDGWDKSLTHLGKKISEVMAEVKSDFWNSMGQDMLPTFMDHSVDQHHDGGHQGAVAVRDAVASEIRDFFQDKGDASFSMAMLGWDKWTISVYEDIDGSDNHYMFSIGHKFRHVGYNIMYHFSSGTSYDYLAKDIQASCASKSAQKQCTCMHKMHNSAVWCLNKKAWWAEGNHGSFFHEYDGNRPISAVAYSMTPGRDASSNAANSRGRVSTHPNAAAVLV